MSSVVAVSNTQSLFSLLPATRRTVVDRPPEELVFDAASNAWRQGSRHAAISVPAPKVPRPPQGSCTVPYDRHGRTAYPRPGLDPTGKGLLVDIEA